MTIASKSIIIFDILNLAKNFQGNFFGDAFSKTYKYVSTNEKVCKCLKYVYVKTTQLNLQKCITWLKKSRKSRQEWNMAYAYSNLFQRKLNVPIKTRLSSKL
jgi:hypothetical protein